MAFPTSVNEQITDSLSEADAPAIAMGNLFLSDSQALSNAAHNATANQPQSGTLSQAANVQGLTTLYSLDTGTTGVATDPLLHPGL